MCSLHFSHPGILPQGQPGAVGEPAMQRPGTKSKCQSCLGQGQDCFEHLLFLHVFVVVGFDGGNLGEHRENMQTPHRKAREQAPTCCTMRDLNPRPSCCEATVLRTEPPCPNGTALLHRALYSQQQGVPTRPAASLKHWSILIVQEDS